MLTAKNKQRLMFRLIAQAGGIDKLDLASEYAKAVAAIDHDSVVTPLSNAQFMPNNMSMTTPQTLQGTNSPSVADNTNQGMQPPVVNQNQGLGQIPSQSQENTPTGIM